MSASSDDHLHSELRQTLASKLQPAQNVFQFAILICISLAFVMGTFSAVAAHPPGNYPDPNSYSSQPSSANTPSPTISSSSGSSSATGTVTFNNVDEARLQEILTNLYTHMKKYEQNSPSSSSPLSSSLPSGSVPSTDSNALNQGKFKLLLKNHLFVGLVC